MRRRWTALAPCPVAKELIDSHPKRTYFYLTTQPHQPIPDHVNTPPVVNRIISPSLSSGADEEGETCEDEERDARSRAALSPSPEIDLSSPDLLDDAAPLRPGVSFSGHGTLGRDGTHPPTNVNIAHNRRAASPPLERDEREFTLTASSLQQRSRSKDLDMPPPTATPDVHMTNEPAVDAVLFHPGPEDTEERTALRSRDDAAKLFGQSSHDARIARGLHLDLSSPVLRPHAAPVAVTLKRGVDDEDEMEDVRAEGAEKALGANWQWTELKSPENIELDELEAMFGEY